MSLLYIKIAIDLLMRKYLVQQPFPQDCGWGLLNQASLFIDILIFSEL